MILSNIQLKNTHKLKICRFGIQQFMWQKFPAIMWTMWKFVLFRSLGLWRETKQKKCRCLVSVLILTENFFLYVTLLKIIFYDRYNCHTLTMNGHLLCGKKETIYSFMLMQWLTIVLCRLSTPERNSLRKRWRKIKFMKNKESILNIFLLAIIFLTMNKATLRS